MRHHHQQLQQQHQLPPQQQKTSVTPQLQQYTDQRLQNQRAVYQLNQNYSGTKSAQPQAQQPPQQGNPAWL